ncbi:endonuclease domain-containing protein [Reyranella sp.]|uniref:endonuclease domain-containing protein n=1 Tax=Reyranella sp. TaxID=1929291 RepID=UPI003BAB4C9F
MRIGHNFAENFSFAAVMLRLVRTLRRNPTDAEYLLWKHLRRRQLAGFRFRRQHPVGSFVSDFACLEARLIVELDGSQHVEQSNYDLRRDAYLRARGFRVLRFWNSDVIARTARVLDTIFEALHRPDMDGRFD